MSKKDINRFIKDLRRLEDLHGVRIGFITIDDGKRQLCSCKGIGPEDPLAEYHLQSLYSTLQQFDEEKD